MYLTVDSLAFIDPNIKFSIKAHLELKTKTLLYDMLLYTSFRTEVSSFCSQNDLDSFLTLLEYCDKLEIDPQLYVACAYNYIDTYATKGHKIPLSYFLNDKVVQYVAEHLDNVTTSNLLMNEVITNITTTEKYLRSYVNESTSYSQAFFKAIKERKIDKLFLAYKVYTKSDILKDVTITDTINKYIKLLEPFFVFALAKNSIYTPYSIEEWNNSKIEDFSFCPAYFKARYITRELSESLLKNKATSTGTKVHSIFETIIEKYHSNKRKDFITIADRYFKSKAFKLLEEDEEIAIHTPYIKELFSTENEFITDLTTAKEIHSEKSVKGRSLKYKYFGTADLILIYDNHAIIYDFKTSKIDNDFYLKKNNYKYSKQLSLYGKLLQQEYPNIATLQLKILYTRGKLQEVGLIDDILIQRSKDITNIYDTLKSGIIPTNSSSCLLCMHPFCASRTKESMWDENGDKKAKKPN